jgi:hypothetical protein
MLDLSLSWFDLEYCDLLGTNAYSFDFPVGAEISEGTIGRRKSKFGLPTRNRAPTGSALKVGTLTKMHSSPDGSAKSEEGDESKGSVKIEKFRKTIPKTARDKGVVSEPTATLPRSSSSARLGEKKSKTDSCHDSDSVDYSPEISKQDMKIINENLRKSKVASMMGESEVLAVTAQMQHSSKLQSLLGEVCPILKSVC